MLRIWQSRDMLVLVMASTAPHHKKTKYLYSTLKESSHTKVCFFSITFSRPGRYPTRRRAASSGPPSCWIATWWRKGDGNEANVGVAALFQAEKQISCFQLTLWILLTLISPNFKSSNFQFVYPTQGSIYQNVKRSRLSKFGIVFKMQCSKF